MLDTWGEYGDTLADLAHERSCSIICVVLLLKKLASATVLCSLRAGPGQVVRLQENPEGLQEGRACCASTHLLACIGAMHLLMGTYHGYLADGYSDGPMLNTMWRLLTCANFCRRVLLQRQRGGGRGAGAHHPAAGRPAQECERLPCRQQARQEGMRSLPKCRLFWSLLSFTTVLHLLEASSMAQHVLLTVQQPLLLGAASLTCVYLAVAGRCQDSRLLRRLPLWQASSSRRRWRGSSSSSLLGQAARWLPVLRLGWVGSSSEPPRLCAGHLI